MDFIRTCNSQVVSLDCVILCAIYFVYSLREVFRNIVENLIDKIQIYFLGKNSRVHLLVRYKIFMRSTYFYTPVQMF